MLTGKQTAFVHAYLGEARFNATAAAKIAGYRATSQHSFEAIGAENLLKPKIRTIIDEHWKLSRMSAEECLGELTKLARGDGKEQIRALALLSQHHGLLDGKWQAGRGGPIEIQVRYEVRQELEKETNAWMDEIAKEVNELNEKGMAIYNEARAKFADSADVQAFCKVYEEMLSGKPQVITTEMLDSETKPPTEVEIIPPERRLQPAAVERLMAFEPEIVEPEPQPTLCQHGNLSGECHVIDIGKDQCEHWYRKNESSYRYA